MEVRVIRAEGAEVVGADRLRAVLADPTALVWVDIPACGEPCAAVLAEVFGFHPIAIAACVERQRMPKVHAYDDHVFTVAHSPELGKYGHVHYVEIDQFVGPRYLVTVHGPTNPAVSPQALVRHTGRVWERIVGGRFQPDRPMELVHAVITEMTRGMEDSLEEVTREVWALEQRVTAGDWGDPEVFLEELFRTRHALLAVVNIAASAQEVQQRMATVTRGLDAADQELLADCIDEYERVHRLASNQRDYLEGVIEFYRTRTDTKMTVAAERLAVIAVVTLPITALASIMGMNVIASTHNRPYAFALAVASMAVMSGILLRWARKHGWW